MKATVFDRVQYQRERAERAEARVAELELAVHSMHIPCVHRAESAEAERDAARDLLRRCEATITAFWRTKEWTDEQRTLVYMIRALLARADSGTEPK